MESAAGPGSFDLPQIDKGAAGQLRETLFAEHCRETTVSFCFRIAAPAWNSQE
jgi:hypothetical protein